MPEALHSRPLFRTRIPSRSPFQTPPRILSLSPAQSEVLSRFRSAALRFEAPSHFRSAALLSDVLFAALSAALPSDALFAEPRSEVPFAAPSVGPRSVTPLSESVFLSVALQPVVLQHPLHFPCLLMTPARHPFLSAFPAPLFFQSLPPSLSPVQPPAHIPAVRCSRSRPLQEPPSDFSCLFSVIPFFSFRHPLSFTLAVPDLLYYTDAASLFSVSIRPLLCFYCAFFVRFHFQF